MLSIVVEKMLKTMYNINITQRNGENMRNIKLTIEYDGKDFNGWQKQPDKLNIQGTIENVIESITGEKVELNASRKN